MVDPPGKAGFGRRPWLLLVILTVLAGCALGWWVWYRAAPGVGATGQTAATDVSGRPGAGRSNAARPGSQSAADRVIPVTVVAAERADVPITLGALGTVTSLNTVVVRPQVSGPLLRVNSREGQLVKAGELLAEIDPRPFQVQLAQAEGQLARDRALLENARVDLKRYRTLVTQDAASQQQLDTQQALVHQYEGTLQSDQGQVENARLQLSYTRIVAPLSGRLGLRLVDAGNIVGPGDANGLVTITQIQPISVVFSLPENELAPVLERYRNGREMEVQAFGRDQTTLLGTGRLTTLDNQIDTTTGTLKMKAQFDNADTTLFPNQFVNVSLRVDTLAGATVVPSAAIQRGSPGTFVYVVLPGDTAGLRKVVAGPVDGGRTVVLSGVEVGDRVVVDGVDNLRDGARIEPVDKVAAERAAQAPAPKRADADAPAGPRSR